MQALSRNDNLSWDSRARRCNRHHKKPIGHCRGRPSSIYLRPTDRPTNRPTDRPSAESDQHGRKAELSPNTYPHLCYRPNPLQSFHLPTGNRDTFIVPIWLRRRKGERCISSGNASLILQSAKMKFQNPWHRYYSVQTTCFAKHTWCYGSAGS